MNHDIEIFSWIIEYACLKNYPTLITDEEKENLTPLATLYNLLATLNHICQIEDFHSNEQLRFILMIQSATLIFNIEVQLKEILGKKAAGTSAMELVDECYYQAILCFTTKRDFQEACEKEGTSPSQQVASTNFFDEVLEGVKSLGSEVLKSSTRIPKSLMNEHKLGDFEEMVAKYVEDSKALLPSPTLFELSKRRHPPQVPTDMKPFTLEELYFAWDGHDVEWELLRDLSHPDIKMFYRNNPNMPKEIRDYVKSLPDSSVTLRKIKTQSGSPAVTSPYFSSSHLSSPSSKSPTATTPFISSSSSFTPTARKQPKSTHFNSQPLTQQPTQDEEEEEETEGDELGGAGGSDREEEMEDEEVEAKEKEDKVKKRKQPDTSTRSDNGRELRSKSKRLHAMGDDPLFAALEYSNEIRKVLDKNKKKGVQESDEEETETEDQSSKKPKKSNINKKVTKSKKQQEAEDRESSEEEELVEMKWTKKPNKSAARNGTNKNKPTTTTTATTQKGRTQQQEEDEDEYEFEDSEKESEKRGGTEDSDEEEKGKKKDETDSSDDDFAAVKPSRLKSPTKVPKIKIAKKRFSPAEEQYIRKGIERYGQGKWKSILLSYDFNGRSVVDLKDKWRNMQIAKSRGDKKNK